VRRYEESATGSSGSISGVGIVLRESAAGETALLEGAPRGLQLIYRAVRDEVAKWQGVEIFATATGSYIGFRYRGYSSALNFAEVHLQKKNRRLLVCLRREITDIAPGTRATALGLEVERVPGSHLWTLNQRVTVVREADVGPAAKLLRRSYEAVRARAG
jgi:hypothetical protein